MLSKSQYLRGMQCLKSLWLWRRRKDLLPPTPPALQAVFDQGHEVGRLARERFPGGRLIAEDHRHGPEAARATKAAMAAGSKVLYEAAAVANDVLVRADILVKRRGVWDLVEVKSAAEVKEEHLHDLSVQRYALAGAGFPMGKSFLMRLDTGYVRRGALDLERLFRLEDVSEAVADLLPGVPGRIEELRRVVDSRGEPVVDIGRHCRSPYACEFIPYCWKEVPEFSVFDLGHLSGKKLALLRERGVLAAADIPEGFPLSEAQGAWVAVARAGQEHCDRPALATLLSQLRYPVHFLDFETVNPALPPYDGLSPYENLPFQASIHVQERPQGPLNHREFLGDGRVDPRPGLAAFLAAAIGPEGSVVAYNASFEARCLAGLAAALPAEAAPLGSIAERLWDAAEPFRGGLLLHPGFAGSWSMKAVLPVLVPELSYEGLAISEGTAASRAYLRLMDPGVAGAEAERIRGELKAYCGRDTEGMAALLEVLRRRVS